MKKNLFIMLSTITLALAFSLTYTNEFEVHPSFCDAGSKPTLPGANGRSPCVKNPQQGCDVTGNPNGMPWVAVCCYVEQDPCKEVRVRLKCCLVNGNYNWVYHEWEVTDPSKTCWTVPNGTECN
jgi:hypothetical protein